jgi:quercetin dioxygenase-like cupin family protein
VLERDSAARTQTVLLRVAPGGRYPGHRHSQEEEFIVLEGECHIGAHRLGTGDVHIAAPGSWHDDITTTTGVLVLVRGEIWAG